MRRRLTILQHLEELGSHWVVGGRQLFHPCFKHLKVAQGAQRAEQLARESFHPSPRSIAIHLLHDRGDGTRTANRHAEVMDGIGIRRFANTQEFLEDTAHSKSQPQSPVGDERELTFQKPSETSLTVQEKRGDASDWGVLRWPAMQELFTALMVAASSDFLVEPSGGISN